MNDIYFVNLEEANEIIDSLGTRNMADTWKVLPDEDKVRYLNQAGLILNNLEFKGTRKVDINQPYEFPRYLNYFIPKRPIFKNYQDYQVAQAIRAAELNIEQANSESFIYKGINRIASEKSGTTSITYFQASEDSDEYLMEKNGLGEYSFKLIRDWLVGGY